MLRRRTLHLLAIVTIASLSLPQRVQGGAFAFGYYGQPCWCDQSVVLNDWNVFSVWYLPDTPGECALTRVAFRLEGVPDDPALMRRFEPRIEGAATGDPFGEGVIVDGLIPLPGNTDVGRIWLYISTPPTPQVWFIQPHRGIPGSTLPVAEFETSLGTWWPQFGHSSWVGRANPQCDSCVGLPSQACPFAVEPRTWSIVKRTYQ